MTYTLTVRLTAEETRQLCQMVYRESCSAENRSEFIRLLLAREWNRREGVGIPPAIQYQTAFRIGRPKFSVCKESRRQPEVCTSGFGDNQDTDAVPV